MVTWLRHRVRTQSNPVQVGQLYDINTGALQSNRMMSISTGTEELWDSGGNPIRHGHYAGGSYFRVFKANTVRNGSGSIACARYNAPDRLYYSGQFFDSGPGISIEGKYNQFASIVQDCSSFNVDNFLNQAWDRLRPDKPSMDLALSVYELKDVPGMLQQRFLKNGLASIGDYYLALKFGWEPLLRDVRDFAILTFDAHKRLQQLQRDQGKLVRRQRKLSSDSDSDMKNASGVGYAGWSNPVVTQAYLGPPTYRDWVEKSTNLWAMGAFKFYLPEYRNTWEWRAKMYARIFGLTPSPATVYHAIPWTWLVDWFSGLGDYINNVAGSSVADSLACHYGYVMQHKRVSTCRTTTGNISIVGGGSTTASSTTKRSYETKERSVLDVFGPSVHQSNLSDSQSAILGALGLSRLKR